MNYIRLLPSPALEPFVECYWQAESDDPGEKVQKIIPDGFPEMIFHYRNPFSIQMKASWEVQAPFLLGGQIRKFFFLKNNGPAGVFGIKFKPAALTHLFGIEMYRLTDHVADLTKVVDGLSSLCQELVRNTDFERQADVTENCLKGFSRGKTAKHIADIAIGMIQNSSGSVAVSQLCEDLATSERNLERIFKSHIGLSPKFFARIVRFSKIFELVRQEDPSWNDLVYETGYYDQSHFIRNFKAFTGEDPTRYLFASPTLANFFLKKTGA